MPEEATLSTTIISRDASNTSTNAGCEPSYSTVLLYAVPMIQHLRDGLRIAIDLLSCCLVTMQSTDLHSMTSTLLKRTLFDIMRSTASGASLNGNFSIRH
ncbi:uncharacterized protein CLUP02_03883 [Colletotrichum lupini]|uniref:Uncharacterized protein n=1 Tax=Colletotrichum lupini TaxID=145971 RepID=A0A9Q8SJB2_9PEZI|nr:uncharacterized protein CLUP02_03883 [Colletotrichum lupini]UQC78406.1 hypothetical protein CLUP02_03883 [Colletotrichum lupini]